MSKVKHVYFVIIIVLLLVIAIFLITLTFKPTKVSLSVNSDTNANGNNVDSGTGVVSPGSSVNIAGPFSVVFLDLSNSMLRLTNIGNEAYAIKRVAFPKCTLIINKGLKPNESYDVKAPCGINEGFISVVYSFQNGSEQRTVTGEIKLS